MSKNYMNDLPRMLHMVGAEIHAINCEHGFWDGKLTSHNKAEKIALMHSELSEALEAIRHKDKGHQPSDHVPAMTAIAEEMADVVIRVLDFCGAYDIDLGRAICSKMAFNEGRPHKHGKEF